MYDVSTKYGIHDISIITSVMVIRTEVKFYTVMTVARRTDSFLYFTAGIIPQRIVQKSVNVVNVNVSLIKYF
jgi:hypothetical protein